MNDQQKLFVERYAIHGVGARAAIEAGYAKTNARQTAYDLKKVPEIDAAIKERQTLLGMSAEEATKRLADIGRTRLNDYMTVEVVWETTWERVPLSKLIEKKQRQIDIDRRFADIGGLTEEEVDKIYEKNKEREREIIRYQIELEFDPKAYVLLKSEPRPVKKATVDLIKLAKADDEGAIKKLSFNERGLPSVELYPADSAMELALKLHGKLVNKLDHTTKGESLNKGFLDFLKKVNRA
jgi:phage terminase small subunit